MSRRRNKEVNICVICILLRYFNIIYHFTIFNKVLNSNIQSKYLWNVYFAYSILCSILQMLHKIFNYASSIRRHHISVQAHICPSSEHTQVLQPSGAGLVVPGLHTEIVNKKYVTRCTFCPCRHVLLYWNLQTLYQILN